MPMLGVHDSIVLYGNDGANAATAVNPLPSS